MHACVLRRGDAFFLNGGLRDGGGKEANGEAVSNSSNQ